MVVEIREYGQGIIHCVVLGKKANSSSGDAELFRAAADWLDTHPDTCLLGMSLEGKHDIDEPETELKLFVED